MNINPGKVNSDANIDSPSTGGNNPASTAAGTSSIAALKKEYNHSIVESQQQVSLASKNEPLSLVLKAALEAINEHLEPTLGENAIETSAEEGIDTSPEATAERIVSQSTAFFSAFQQQNSDLSFEEQLDKFIEVISGGIETGFTEARDILDGLGVLEGEVADNIDKTYDLVQQGLDDFKASTEQQALSENN